MRKLLIAIGVVLVLVLATPFVVGIIAEGTVRTRLDAMNESQFPTVNSTPTTSGCHQRSGSRLPPRSHSG